ncbi:MAG TPA: UDP-3-O-(3-hydroxymyristoyl)glucosamine N-acyltransferase, partial [Coleofasciculaceae cyanobacterium]
GLAGGAQLGDRVILGGQVGVSNQAKVGDGVQAGAQAGIHGNVTPGTILLGTPAIPQRLYLKASALFNRLPEIHQSLKQIQRQLGKPE